MPRLFGTDGVRGLANREVTAELALSLGASAARVLTQQGDFSGRRPRAIIGRDPRISGQFISAALVAGMTSAGVDVTDLGVVPTPAVAYLTGSMAADLAVMVSASHNAMPDNGIKFFARGGNKLEDTVEDAVEEAIGRAWSRPTGADVGRISFDRGASVGDYVEHLLGVVDADLTGLRIAVDAANGAASKVGPDVLRAAGADVVVINASPDGRNINDQCGSTHPEQLQAVTAASEAHLGVAFDGDADRCLAVDATGVLVDGDQIMGILARAKKAEGTLAHDTLVLTVMSNLGLLLAMEEDGIHTVQAGVGDRYVLEAMRAGGYNLGGEQSGHIVFTDHATTGDGLLTALQLAAQVVRSGRSLAGLAGTITRLPQVLVNVGGVDKARAGQDPEVAAAVAASGARLGHTGRVLLRPSGTEPVVRVMVEAATREQATAEANALAELVEERLRLG